jgi:NADH-quinone oxidoreductase subunit M
MANDNMIQIPFIALSIVLPLLGLTCLAYFQDYLGRRLALVFSGLSVICIIGALYIAIASGTNFVAEQYSYYIPALSVLLNLRLDPISFALSLMAGIVAFVALLSGNTEQEHEKLAGSLILLFQASAMGLFAAGNLFLFFIFWDVGVVAMFFMLYMLGSANRRRAAMKFLLYELLASLFLLLAIMMIYFYTPLHSFDIQYIIQNSQLIPTGTQLLIFFFLFAAFLINMPVFPVHLWLPDAHTEASTQGSMLLSGALTKFGGYGMILTFFMLPMSSQFSVFIAILATFSAFYAA